MTAMQIRQIQETKFRVDVQNLKAGEWEPVALEENEGHARWYEQELCRTGQKARTVKVTTVVTEVWL